MVIGQIDPLDECHRLAVAGFEEMQADLLVDIQSVMTQYALGEPISDWAKVSVATGTTWSYEINDSPGQFSPLPMMIGQARTKTHNFLQRVKKWLGFD